MPNPILGKSIFQNQNELGNQTENLIIDPVLMDITNQNITNNT